MEGRKLQLAGKSTFLVSLPKRWVTASGLKAGDTLFVETSGDGSISVRSRSPERLGSRRKVFVERDAGSRDHLLRKLMGAYVAAFDLIEVRFASADGPFVRKVAREFCHRVIGPAVIEEGPGTLLVQDLSDPSELSSEKCLRRMHLTVRSMLDDAVRSWVEGDASLAPEVDLRSQDVDRLFWMISKQYHLAQVARPLSPERLPAPVLHAHRSVARSLQRVGEHAQRIARAWGPTNRTRTLDPTFLEDLGRAGTSAIAILDTAFRSFAARSLDEANGAIDARPDHQRRVDALFRRASVRKGDELLALGSVVDSLGRAAVYASEVAEEAIDLTILLGPDTV